MSLDIAWAFDAWGGHPAKKSDKEIIVFMHPMPDNEANKLEVEEDVPDLAPLPHDNASVSSDKLDNTNASTYCDLDNLTDNAVDYITDLKNHTELVRLIQTLVDADKAIKKVLQTYLCERKPRDKLLVFAVTTGVQNKADKACKTPPEEPPTEAPPHEPLPTVTMPPIKSQVPVLNNGEIGLPDKEDNLYSQPIKVTG